MKRILFSGLICLLVNTVQAQETTNSKQAQLERLKAQQDSLSRQVSDLEKEVKNGSKKISFTSERPMQLVTAKLADKRLGTPAGGIRCYLSVPGNKFELRTAMSDSTGTVNFLLKDVYATRPVIFQTDPRSDSLYRFEVGDPFQGKRFSVENDNDSLAFFGTPDKRYMLDDYTRFPTMEEVLIEYVSEINIKKAHGHFFMRVLNTPYQSFFTEAPLVLIDGVPVFNLDAFMAIDPLKIKKLEVMARRYYYGTAVWDGVVSFTSYDGDLAGYSLYENAVVKEFHK